MKNKIIWILVLLVVMMVSSVTGTLSNYTTESGWNIKVTSDYHGK